MPLLKWYGAKAITRGGKLPAARRGKSLGYWLDLGPYFHKYELLLFIDVFGFRVEMNPVRASWVKMASKVEEAFLRYPFVAQTFYHQWGFGVKQVVIMPRVLVGVNEYDRVWKSLIIIDDIGKIYHRFVPLVGW